MKTVFGPRAGTIFNFQLLQIRRTSTRIAQPCFEVTLQLYRIERVPYVIAFRPDRQRKIHQTRCGEPGDQRCHCSITRLDFFDICTSERDIEIEAPDLWFGTGRQTNE